MTRPMIETTGLTKRLGATEVLRGVDLRIGAGEIFALLGPNGAGKTTTVRILATLSRPGGGSARVAGADVVTQRRAVRRQIALTGQYAALDEVQTGQENLAMMARLAGLFPAAAARRTDELLARFDLHEAAGRRVVTYSGGMRRRLDLAVSLVRDPAVIFLDEPTTGLDPRSRQDMWHVVAELAHGGTTVFLTTQYLEEADRLADRIAVIDAGRIVAAGTAGELKGQVAGHRLELSAASDAAFDALLGRLGPWAILSDPATRTVGVAIEDDAAQIRRVLDDLDPNSDLVERFAVRSASLDDVFLALTGRATSTPKEPAHG